MDSANRFLDYLIEETTAGRIKWTASYDYFTAKADLLRKGILLRVLIRKSGDAVSVHIQPHGEQAIKLVDLDKPKTQALSKMVEKAIEIPAEVVEMLNRVVNDFLQ